MDARNNRRTADGYSVVTASRLIDGRTVWQTAEGGWSATFADARVLPNDKILNAIEAARADERRQLVVGVYGVEILPEPKQPVTMRERIRAFGPGVHPEFCFINNTGRGG